MGGSWEEVRRRSPGTASKQSRRPTDLMLTRSTGGLQVRLHLPAEDILVELPPEHSLMHLAQLINGE